MKSGKPIDISKSSLVSLKAELSKKQDEVRQAKGSESYIKLPPKPKDIVTSNAGVDERNRQDLELLPEEIDLLKKSREVLEVKAKLYDELQKGKLVPEDGKDRYLVDFKHKDVPSGSGMGPCQPTEEEREGSHRDDDDDIDDIELDDSEWVEYRDCLGRTRTCHRSDLTEMKEADLKMARELHHEKARDEEEEERPLDLLSSDMEREAMRRKWEQQERELLDKKNIHYEDVLFDEARAHGVGYFKFSKDETDRRREQETLRKVREETESRQKEARLLRERREGQRQTRLIAARQRQRARMGLPPLSEQEILAEITPKVEVTEKEEEPAGPSSVDNLEETLKKAAHVRPWDIGKGPDSEPAMTQEEWVDKQRSERKPEFAPFHVEGGSPGTTGVTYDPTRPPPEVKKRRLVRREPISLEEEIEARLGHIRDQILGDRPAKS